MSNLSQSTTIGRYRLDDELGNSDIVQVFRAYDVKLERHVILKLVTHSKGYSNNFTDYFLREARTLAQLSHPGISKVLDFGRDQGYLYLVMENVSGVTLAERMGSPMEWRSAIELILPIAQALAYAHNNNVIHRDLKPTNILINADGHPVLSDFSIARIVEDEETREMTGTNAGLGTPAYMSPEQGKGMPVDYRADIYSLGIIFFELVTGQPPFSAENSMEVLIQQVMAAPPSPRKIVPDLPVNVEKIILTMLKKDPDERFQTVEELIDALEAVCKGREFRKAPRKRAAQRRSAKWLMVVAALLLVALTAVTSYQLFFNPPQPTVVAYVEASPTVTLTPTLASTPTPQATVEPSLTPVPPTPTLASFAFRREFPAYPLGEGKGIAGLGGQIDLASASNIREALRFGAHPASQALWSRDDSSIIIAASNGLYFYTPDKLEQMGFLALPGWPSSFTTSNDETMVAVGDRTGKIHILDAMNGNLLADFTGHEKRVTSVSFSPDGKKLASASEDRSVRIWDIENEKELFVLKKHSLPVNSVLFSNNGNWILSGSDDFHVIFWDPQNGSIIDDRSYGKRVTALAISKDDSVLAVGLSDATAQLWSIEGKRQLQLLKDATQVSRMTVLNFSPTGSLLLSGAEDGLVRIWNVASGDKLRDFTATETKGRALTSGDIVASAQFSNDGTRVLSLTQSSLVKVWSLDEQDMLAQVELGNFQAKNIEFTAQSDYLLISYNNNTVQAINVKDTRLALSVEGSAPSGYPLSPDGPALVLQNKGLLHLYRIDNRTPKYTYYGLPPGGLVSFLPGSNLFAASATRSIILWTTTTGLEISKEMFKYEGNCQVAFSKDKEFLAAGSGFGPITNPDTYTTLCKVTRNPRKVSSDLSRDGSVIAQGLENGSIQVDIAEEKLTTTIFKDILSGRVLAVAISPDSKLLAASGQDGTVVLVDIATGDILQTLNHHTAAVRDLAFSPDRQMLASCSDDGTVQIWGILEN